MRTLKRVISALRAFFGWDVASEERLSPPYGWLLATPGELGSLRTEARTSLAGSRGRATRA